MSHFDLSLQDIDSEESVSQPGGSYMSTATSSRDIAGSSSQASFLAYFDHGGEEFTYGDKYMIVVNDPVILARAESILGVQTLLIYKFFRLWHQYQIGLPKFSLVCRRCGKN
jgi:hypothetical protein